jgi:capsular polysaccharide biosynthesis protein
MRQGGQQMKEDYDEIDLLELVHHLKRRWWLIVLMMLVCAYGTYYYTVTYITPIYQAKSTLFIGKEPGTISALSIGDVSLGNQLVGDYSQLVKTRLVTEQVTQGLSLNTSTADIVENLSVTVIPDTRFIYIAYNDPIPQRAEMIVNRLSEVLAAKAEQVVGVKNVMIVDYALIPEEPISPSILRNVAIAAILGMMGAVFTIFAMMSLNSKLQNEEEIERMFGITVIASIPKFKGAVRL